MDTIDTHIGKTLVVVSCSVENMHAINHLASSVQKMRATAPWTRIVRPPLFSMKDCQTCQNIKSPHGVSVISDQYAWCLAYPTSES